MDISQFKPFENDSQIVALDDLSIENGKEEILIVGSFTVQKSDPDPEQLDALIGLLTSIRQEIKQ